MYFFVQFWFLSPSCPKHRGDYFVSGVAFPLFITKDDIQITARSLELPHSDSTVKSKETMSASPPTMDVEPEEVLQRAMPEAKSGAHGHFPCLSQASPCFMLFLGENAGKEMTNSVKQRIQSCKDGHSCRPAGPHPPV